MSTLGKRIKELRKAKKYTQEFIGSKLNMGRSNFGHIENDRVTPSAEDLEKIADILETTTDYLLGRNNLIVSESREPYNITSDELNDLKEILLSKGEVKFDGVLLDENKKQRVMDILTGLFWENKGSIKKDDN
ncbi:transcriptional regulator with XRE-family HTH domain [Paenibacillus turicensis]|uniref:Transcriptional regulator with XRE-family HTH domain n=1 Tax=Paenibacillus turicensis TaxID=160487 RepID=A0ABS4FRY7_9BACL|nr:helix-turn-helix transcriptional regulator [Paenibacillus turicensis]MBP1905296.1 transcriptional regulator with XRE-family HTH domain [Paenibacillus turicensis]